MKIAQKLLLIITGALITFLVANVIIVGSQFTQLSEDITIEDVASKLRSDINATNAFFRRSIRRYYFEKWIYGWDQWKKCRK